ncbi:MAG: hypothetical protein JXR58_09425 [Bacteroidales bacterium]|nr:hypothetical protein [Bacteroidales bacterium]
MKNKILSVLLVALAIITLNSCEKKEQKQAEAAPEKVCYDGSRPIQADTADLTNDFYDNAETVELEMTEISVEGEIENPGKVDFSKLPMRSVIVKETLLDGNGDKFVGAYRYDGYSLYDILNNCRLAKKNADSFRPIIDLYVELENSLGEKSVISWGEIYYPNHLHEILIAKRVMRIVPSKTNELWDLPEKSKLVVSTDLITERNISQPVKISVKSHPIELETIKGKKPLFSPTLDIVINDEKVETFSENPKNLTNTVLHTIFYGRGRGIHSTLPFDGVKLKDYFAEKIKRTQKSLREGLFVFAADDGYRAVYTYSEVCNRNDQEDVLLVCRPELTDNGIFRVFPACDFFSDRAVKGMKTIYYFE